MRVTLEIADDVLLAAKEVARREKKTLGEVISDLTRRALKIQSDTSAYGIHPLPPRGAVVTNELIDRLRDEEGA